MNGTKPIYRSKTFWFNVLALIVTVAGAFGFSDFKLSPDYQQLAVGLVAIINLALRFATDKGITLS